MPLPNSDKIKSDNHSSHVIKEQKDTLLYFLSSFLSTRNQISECTEDICSLWSSSSVHYGHHHLFIMVIIDANHFLDLLTAKVVLMALLVRARDT